MERELSVSSYLLTDLAQSEDEYSDLYSGFSEGPFPKNPNPYSGAERLNKNVMERFSTMKPTMDFISKLYMQVVILENHFRYNRRDPDFIKRNINQDIVVQANSETSLALQYALCKKFKNFDSNRYQKSSEEKTLINSSVDVSAREAMILSLHSLANKSKYTLTAYLWTGKLKEFGPDVLKKDRTEALNYFIETEIRN